MREHGGVVVDVHDAAFWRDPLCDFVSVVGSGQTGADVEELTNSRLTSQVLNSADQEPSLGADGVPQTRDKGKDPISGLPVDRVVVLTT